MLVAIAGRVARAFIAETQGVYRDPWAIEQVAEQIGQIRDAQNPRIFEVVPSGHLDHIRYSFGFAAQAGAHERPVPAPA
jgi:LmbE family N-acetylglucosaminyl deacetylase